MKQYIYRLPKRTGNPNDAIVKGEVYWLHDMNPRFGRTKSYGFEAKKLFSFTNPDATVQQRFRDLGSAKKAEKNRPKGKPAASATPEKKRPAKRVSPERAFRNMDR